MLFELLIIESDPDTLYSYESSQLPLRHTITEFPKGGSSFEKFEVEGAKNNAKLLGRGDI